MHKYLFINLIVSLMIGAICFSCNDTKPELEDKTEITTSLSGTRWNTGNWDYSIGDDYITVYEEGIEYLFYSSTEGVLYEWGKVYDSDFGNSHNRRLCFFTYECTGSNVNLTFITPTTLSTRKLILEKNRLSETNGISYLKKSIDSSTKTWLAGKHGSTGDCKWYYDLVGTLVINGNGKMADYSSWNDTPWSKLTKYHAINKVELANGVLNAGNYAFSSPNIAEVTLNSKTETIGVGAFCGSTLGSILIPASVKEIKSDAFAGCKYLKSISGMHNVEIIGDCAFQDCKSISLILCDKIRSIGKMAFSGCSVTNFTKSEELESIETGAFSNCTFSTLKLPKSLKYLGHSAFSSTKINRIEIGSGLTSVSGTPFFVASSGTVYVDKNTPINITRDFVEGANKWTLRVPSGSKNAYSKASYWKNFKNIYEDSSLLGDGTTPKNPDDNENSQGNEESKKYQGTLNGYDWKDLGLSVKWATKNVGANSELDTGEYLLWGRTSTDWETDFYTEAGKDWAGTGYDPLTRLWGKKWKTPTKEQFEELISNCTFTLVKENGKSYIKATSKINKQYLIFPLCGKMEGRNDYGETTDQLKWLGQRVYLWTLSSYINKNGYEVAYYFYIDSNAIKNTSCEWRTLCRYIYEDYERYPIRGVCD